MCVISQHQLKLKQELADSGRILSFVVTNSGDFSYPLLSGFMWFCYYENIFFINKRIHFHVIIQIIAVGTPKKVQEIFMSLFFRFEDKLYEMEGGNLICYGESIIIFSGIKTEIRFYWYFDTDFHILNWWNSSGIHWVSYSIWKRCWLYFWTFSLHQSWSIYHMSYLNI